MVLTNPDGIVLYPGGTSPDVVLMKGSSYEYYFLKNPAMGNWIIRVQPLDRTMGDERFTLISGQVSGAIPSNPPRIPN